MDWMIVHASFSRLRLARACYWLNVPGVQSVEASFDFDQLFFHFLRNEWLTISNTSFLNLINMHFPIFARNFKRWANKLNSRQATVSRCSPEIISINFHIFAREKERERAFTFQYTPCCIKSVEASFDYDQYFIIIFYGISDFLFQLRSDKLLRTRRNTHKKANAFFFRVFTMST